MAFHADLRCEIGHVGLKLMKGAVKTSSLVQSIIHRRAWWDCFPRNTNSAKYRYVYLPGFLARDIRLKASAGQALARTYTPPHSRQGISLATGTAG